MTGSVSRGVTLIEISMAVLIGAILSLAVTRIFSSGIKISQKGSSHLTNMQNASILMSQLEQDLCRAIEFFNLEPGGESANKIEMKILSEDGERKVSYFLLDDKTGVRRTVAGGAGTPQSYVFCRNLKVEFFISAKEGNSLGFSAIVMVRTLAKSSEEAVLRRFIFCPNLPKNRNKVTGVWIY